MFHICEKGEITMALLNVNDLQKVYTTRLGGAKVQALAGVSFTVEQGEFVAIMGESGSGKTTLLNILAGLDKPTGGEVFLNMRNIVTLNEREISAFRRDNLGFVFQDFNLLDTFSIQDNIFLPMVLAGKKYPEMKQRIDPIAHKLGIWELLQKFPFEVSGGQKQRAAIARAIITQPQLILADEPTGALDSRSAGQIMDIFADINRDGQTILMVTHSLQAACRAGRVLFIKDGQVFHQIYRGTMSDDDLYQAISQTLVQLSVGSRGRSVAVNG
jgi:putative ABC transport system ATP-binding protein